MATRGPVRGVVLCVAALSVICDGSVALRAQNAGRAGGLAVAQAAAPWIGDDGITESVSDIMARELMAAPLNQRAMSIRGRNRQHDRNPNLAQHPASPEVPRWPFDDADAAVTAFLPQTVGTNFLGVQSGIESPFIPPDSMGAVGPTQFLVVVNGRIKVFDKAGNLGPLNADTDVFFQSVLNGSSLSDPRVVYDRLSGRFFISAISVATPNRILLAVSSSSTVTGTGSW